MASRTPTARSRLREKSVSSPPRAVADCRGNRPLSLSCSAPVPFIFHHFSLFFLHFSPRIDLKRRILYDFVSVCLAPDLPAGAAPGSHARDPRKPSLGVLRSSGCLKMRYLQYICLRPKHARLPTGLQQPHGLSHPAHRESEGP